MDSKIDVILICFNSETFVVSCETCIEFNEDIVKKRRALVVRHHQEIVGKYFDDDFGKLLAKVLDSTQERVYLYYCGKSGALIEQVFQHLLDNHLRARALDDGGIEWCNRVRRALFVE